MNKIFKRIGFYSIFVLTLIFLVGCTPKEVTISFETNSGIQLQAVKVEQNALLTGMPVATRTGHDFMGWFYDLALSQPLDATAPVLRNITLYAKWQMQTYDITFVVDQVPNIVTITYGDLGYLPADPLKTGYHFLGWYIGNDAFDEDMVITSDLTITALFEIDEYTITFDLGNGTLQTVTVYYGDDLTTLPSSELTPMDGKLIVWKTFTDQVLGGVATFDNISSDMIVKSVYVDVYLIVTMNDLLGNIQTISVKYGDLVTRPLENPIKEHYTFSGWVTSNGLQYDFNSIVTEEFTITASYTILKFQVTFYNESGQMIGSPQTIDYGANATAPSYTPPLGFDFSGWDKAFTNISGNTQVNVVLQGRFYDIVFDSAGGSSISTINQMIGESVTRPVNPTKEGYTFGGWYTDLTLTLEYVSFTTMPYNGLLLYAKWTSFSDTSYTVTIERIFLKGAIEVSRSTVTTQVNYGSEFSPVSQIAGYSFHHFIGSDLVVHDVSSDTLNITSDETVQVTYDLQSFTINFTQFLSTAEDTSTASFTVYYDESFVSVPSLILTGNPLYSLVVWNRTVFQNVKSNIDVVAVYYPATGKTVTFTDNGTIKYIISESDIPTGQMITVNSAIWNLQKPGFIFLGWFYDTLGNKPVGITELNFSTLSASVNLYALWQQLYPFEASTNVTVSVVGEVVTVTWNQSMLSGVYPSSFILLIDGVEYVLTSSDFSSVGGSYTYTSALLNVLKNAGTHHVAIKAKGDNLTNLNSLYSLVYKHVVAVQEEEISEVAVYDYFIIETTVLGNTNYIFYTDMTYNFSSKYSFLVLEGNNFISADQSTLRTTGTPGLFEIMMFKNVDGVITQTLIKGRVVTYINQFQLGQSLSNFINETSADNYLNPVFDTYKVGNRNDFYFSLSILNNSGTKVSMDQTLLDFTFYLKTGGTYTLLTGETLASYVTQKPGYIFKFSTLAQNKQFKVEIKPRYQALQMTVPMRSFEFVVEDAYNAFTNAQLQMLFKDLTIHHIILQADIIAQIDPQYLNADGSPMNGYAQVLASGTITYRGNVYQRIGIANNDSLVIDGNYFTIDGSGLPFVKVTSDPDTDEFGNGGYTDVGVGTGSAYGIVNVQVGILCYNVTPDPTGIIINNDNRVSYRNLTVIGNTTTPSVNYSLSAEEILYQEQLMSINSGGLAGVMTRNGTTNLENVNIGYTGIAVFLTAYGYLLDGITPVSTNVNYIRLYDSWANSFYNFGSPLIDIKNSNIGSSGGAAIHVEDVRAGNSGIDNITVNIDKETVINNWIAGDEAWFKAYGFSGLALLLKSQAEGMLATLDKTIIRMEENHITGALSEKINFIILSRDLESADTFDALFNQTSGSEIVLNLQDVTGTYTLNRSFNFLSTDLRSQVVSPGTLLFPVGVYSSSTAFLSAFQTAYAHMFPLLSGYGYTAAQIQGMAINAVYIAGFYNLTVVQGENAVLAIGQYGLSVYDAVFMVTGGVMPLQPKYLEIAQEAAGLGKVQLFLEISDKEQPE